MKLKFALLILVSIALQGCSSEPKAKVSTSPASIRGWIADIEQPDGGVYKLQTATTRAAQAKMDLFRQTSVVVDGTAWASGGVAEYGAFMILDVPPGDVTLTFTAPHVNDVKVPLRNVPENADILLAGLVLTTKGATLADPSKVIIRVPEDDRRPTPGPVTIAGSQIPVKEVPLQELADRREWITPAMMR